MNIFVLDKNPIKAAQQHCDKHVVKMILESAQMLSTAHRILDGKPEMRRSASGKTMQKYWVLPDARDILSTLVQFGQWNQKKIILGIIVYLMHY
jgi:hypothetical protein